MFVKKFLAGGFTLSLLLAGCGTPSEEARTVAVHDGMRVLGLAEMSEGSYEFRLCDLADSYTPEVLQDECINPLVSSDGTPVIFSSVPGKPDVFSAQIGNLGITAVVIFVVGILSYTVIRYMAKNEAIHSLGRESHVVRQENALEASKQYKDFKLPDQLEKDLLNDDGNKIKGEIRDPLLAGKGSKLGNEADVNKWLIELRDELKSGPDYLEKLTKGLSNLDGGVSSREAFSLIIDKRSGRSLEGSVREAIRHNWDIKLEKNMKLRKGELYSKKLEEGLAHLEANDRVEKFDNITNDNGGKLTLKDDIREAIEGDKVADLQKELDDDVREAIGGDKVVDLQKELDNLHNSISEKMREAVVSLDELVSKNNQEMVQEAIKNKKKDDLKGMLTVELEKRKEKLEAMTEGYERVIKLTEEVSNGIDKGTKEDQDDVIDGIMKRVETVVEKIVVSGDKGGKDIREFLEGVEKDVEKIVASGDEGEKDIREFLENMGEKLEKKLKEFESVAPTPNKEESLAKEPRAKLKEWSVHLRKAKKELKNRLKDDGYRKKEEALDGIIRGIANDSDTIKVTDEIEKVKESVLEIVDNISHNAPELKIKMETYFEEADGSIDNITSNISKIIEDAHRDGLIGEVRMKDLLEKIGNIDGIKKKNIFARFADRIRNFRPITKNTFKYRSDGEFKVKVENRDRVVQRLANEEEVGIITIEKGVEKLVGHVAAAVAVPFTLMSRKLPGQAKISVGNRWEDLTGGYSLTTSARVDDMRHIIEGLADATGSKVSDEVFYFLLRSGVVER